MTCTKCDVEMTPKQKEFDDEFRGESVKVVADGLVCPSCGYEWFSLDDVAEYGRRVADAYRRKHRLLTSNDIREARERMGMSQEAFSRLLAVGVASVKRWEWGAVQDRSQDKLIRLVTDPEEADAAAKQARSLMRTNPSQVANEIAGPVSTWAAIEEAVLKTYLLTTTPSVRRRGPRRGVGKFIDLLTGDEQRQEVLVSEEAALPPVPLKELK